MISEELLHNLISMPKKAVKAERKKMIVQNRSSRNTIYLESDDGKYTFSMFLRQSTEFPDDFSVGLIWTNAAQHIEQIKRNLILLRCQGPHDSKEPLEYDVHHSYHIHQLTAEDVEEKRYTKPAHKGVTDEFKSFYDAIQYFISYCHITNIDRYAELPGASECIGQTTL